MLSPNRDCQQKAFSREEQNFHKARRVQKKNERKFHIAWNVYAFLCGPLIRRNNILHKKNPSHYITFIRAEYVIKNKKCTWALILCPAVVFQCKNRQKRNGKNANAIKNLLCFISCKIRFNWWFLITTKKNCSLCNDGEKLRCCISCLWWFSHSIASASNSFLNRILLVDSWWHKITQLKTAITWETF